MEQVNVHQVKTNLSRLLERVAGGEEIGIAKSGRPMAKLVPIPSEPRRPGRLKGKMGYILEDALRAYRLKPAASSRSRRQGQACLRSKA